jgi:hypothetical protein
MSPKEDLGSGGANYFFARVARNNDVERYQMIWKPSTLRRLDAVTYNSDRYGRTTGTFVRDNRKNQGIESFREAARHSDSNETIFKQSLSILDSDFECWVVKDVVEKQKMIQVMKKHGYFEWPGGRKLEEVFLTKTEASTKYGR